MLGGLILLPKSNRTSLQKNTLRNAEKRLQARQKDKYISKAERARLALVDDNTAQNKDNER